MMCNSIIPFFFYFYYLEAKRNIDRMPLPIPTNANSENESDFSESESELDSENSTLTGDYVNSDDDDEYFIRFNSTTNYDNVEYIMICSTCYELPYDNSLSNQDSDEDEKEEERANSEEYEFLGCQYDVLVYFINGYVDQQMMSKNEINDLCRLQEINVSSHNVFEHLLN